MRAQAFAAFSPRPLLRKGLRFCRDLRDGSIRIHDAFVRLPWVTVLLGLVAAALWWLPGWAEACTACRNTLVSGKWTTLVLSNLTHWNLSHLAWDLAVFLILGAIAEFRDRRNYTLVLLLCSVACPVAAFLSMPDLERYRGLSGIDTGLFMLVLLTLRQEAPRLIRLVLHMVLLLFVTKTALEYVSGETIFVRDLGSHILPVPAAHVAGACAGAIVHAVACAKARSFAGRRA
jgi:rhomboid family GlyGly-CTERM serine protease